MDFGARAKRVKATDHNIGPIDEDLMINVLCRLPPKILIQCSCVCKGWLELIDLYCVPRITPSVPFFRCYLRVKTDSKNRVVALASSSPQLNPIVDLEDIFHPQNHSFESSYPEFMQDFFQSPKYLIDSCNGLMLFKHPNKCAYVLWNPTTKQFLFISSPDLTENRIPSAALAVEPTWKLDRKRDFFKIIAFPSKDLYVVKVLSSSKCSWVECKVKYNRPIYNNTFDNGKRTNHKFVYLHGKLFTLCRHRLLLWYTIRDDNVDVVCDYVKLPLIEDRSGGKRRRKEGCIGSCGDRLQFAENDQGGSLVHIWAFSMDTGEWNFMHRVSFEALVKYPQFPAVEAEFKLLSFDPNTDDGVIIWTPYRIACYYYKSGNLVSLQCTDILNSVLKDPPYDTFSVTPCLTPLLYKGGGRHCVIQVAKLPDGSTATWVSLTEERKMELVSTRLCSLLL